MNGRLKLIEQQLIGIDSAAFQNLCDVYLFLREQEIASINRTGSQFGKQKTTKGTPDTFFRLDDGSLRYVEYTTKADGLVAKIIEDIDKCLDTAKTNIDPKEVHKIIICFNSKLAADEEHAITQHAQFKNVRIELIGLDWLALEIYSKYLILAKDILGLPLDTGQLLPIRNFVEEYNNKAVKLTTPLDNIFLYRETELKDIEQSFLKDDIIILSGFPGVGKTKIAIEAIEKFITQNTSYHAFAVSKKDQDISDDLKIQLQKDNDYILLVDDANRQLLNFKQILGIFKEKRKGKIKLLITVRDYALYDVANECSEYGPKQISLKKFTDEEIIGIISSDSFEIRNSKYQRKIVEVCDGNARLAVMAARIAKEKQEHFLFGDVSDLYDSYFLSFVKDYDIFRNSSLLKTLAIISFFYTINRSDKKFIELVLQTFSVDYHEFNEAIEELNNRELVEIQYDHVRISEQVMATYFFYVAFIKNDTLSFRNLLFTFFKDWQKRFSDTIIPANNSFGYNNVFEKINPALNEYIQSIYSDENAIANFFSIFWFYKRDELLNYVHSKITELETPLNPVYKIENDRTDIFGTRDNIINLLSNLFIDFTESYSVAIELAFEYCTRKPSTFPILIKKINEIVSFDSDDSNDGFIRQKELFKILANGIERQKPVFLVALCGIANKFLGYSFQKTTSLRRRAFSLYRYQLPITDTIKDLRKKIWQTLFRSYEIHPNEIFVVIKEFHPYEPIIELLDFDLSLLVPFVDAKFSSTSFKHILYINELIRSLDRVQGIKRDYQNLGKKFTSSEYEVFRKLDWSLARTGYKYTNHLDFEKHVRSEIANNFTFNSQSDFTRLENGLKTILTNDEALKGSGLIDSLDIIVEANFSHNEEIGFSLLQRLFICWPNLPVLKSSINAIVNKNEEFASRLWKLILGSTNENKLYW